MGAFVAREIAEMYNSLLGKINLSRENFASQKVTLSGQDLADLLVRQSRAVFIELEEPSRNQIKAELLIR